MGTIFFIPKPVEPPTTVMTSAFDLQKGIHKDEVSITYVDHPGVSIHMFSNFRITKRKFTVRELREIYSLCSNENKKILKEKTEYEKAVCLMMLYHLRKNKIKTAARFRSNGVYCQYGYIRFTKRTRG